MTKRKKFIVVDSSNNEVECYTVRKAAKLLNMTIPELKLAMFKRGQLPYYRLMGKAKKRKIIRITGADLREYRNTKDMFSSIADRIAQAMKEMPMTRQKPVTRYVPVTRYDMRQDELAKKSGLSRVIINMILRKKARAGIKMLEKIAKALDKKFEWFLQE